MQFLIRSVVIFMAAAVIFLTAPARARAQMPPSSLIEIPASDAEYAARLDEQASRSGDVGDFFRLKLAEARLRQGDEKAARKFAERAESKPLKFWKSVAMAEAFLADGHSRKALSLLGTLPPRPRPELSFGETFYANLYKRALLTLRDAKLSLGESADLESAELAANYPMDACSAGYTQDLPVEQKIVKLHVLVFAYRYAFVPGIVTPEEIISSRVSHEQKCNALYDLGYGLRQSPGMAADAVAAFEALLGERCERNLEARALYWIGSLGPAAQMDEEADRALTRLIHEFKGNRFQDDGYYLLYKRAGRRGDAALAQQYFKALMNLPRGDMRDKLAFEMAFPRYMKRDFAGASAILEPLVESDAAGEGFVQVLYWYARSMERMGGGDNSAKARKVYERIVADYPYSFYATTAAQRAGIPLKIPALPELKGKAPPHDDGVFALIDELNRDGMHAAAKQAMDLAMNLNPEWEKTHEEFIARTFIESQNYRKALDMASRHFDSNVYGSVEPLSDPMFAAFFPLAFSEAVTAGYRLTGLPRGAIEAVMREESLFQCNVRSHAGATGLMQLMPATAAIVASGNAGGASASDLTRPADNVLLGASYLKMMLDQYDQRMPLAIMAYNAGPGRVNGFLRNLGKLDLDEFIENIPIDETRGYVKRVMRSMQVYDALYDEAELKNSRPGKVSKRR